MITNIGKAHLEGFGGIEGVIKGKGELYEYVRSHQKKIFINSYDEVLQKIAQGITKITYGKSKDANFIGELIPSSSEFIRLKLRSLESEFEVNTNLIGEYNFYNVLVALCIGNYFGLNSNEMSRGIENYVPNNKRSEIQITERKNHLILDAYNANPSSMDLALDNFIKTKANNKFFIIGNMLELGEYSKEEHLKLVDKLFSNNLKGVLIGGEFQKLKQSKFPVFLSVEELKNAKILENVKDHTILIKGSRGNELEKVITEL